MFLKMGDFFGNILVELLFSCGIWVRLLVFRILGYKKSFVDLADESLYNGLVTAAIVVILLLVIVLA